MLGTYTPLASLSPGERQQIMNVLPNMVLEGRAYVDIGGKYISCAELRAVKESMVRPAQRQKLFE